MTGKKRSARAPTATRGGACAPQAMKFVVIGEDLGVWHKRIEDIRIPSRLYAVNTPAI